MMVYTRIYKDAAGNIIHVACQDTPFTGEPIQGDPRNDPLTMGEHEIELPEGESITAREVLDNFELNGAGALQAKSGAPAAVKDKVLSVVKK